MISNENNNNSANNSFQQLLQKELHLAKQKQQTLSSNNQRLISQNITLCECVKTQKQEMLKISEENQSLEKQINRLFTGINTLSKNQKQTFIAKELTKSSLKKEYQILQNMHMRKNDQISILQKSNKNLLSINNQQLEKENEMKKKVQSLMAKKLEIENERKEHLFCIQNNNKIILEMKENVKKYDYIFIENRKLNEKCNEYKMNIDEQNIEIKKLVEYNMKMSSKVMKSQQFLMENQESFVRFLFSDFVFFIDGKRCARNGIAIE